MARFKGNKGVLFLSPFETDFSIYLFKFLPTVIAFSLFLEKSVVHDPEWSRKILGGRKG